MRVFFTFLSFVYIFCIFFWADSSIVQSLAPFNPYSLLHIPLYGILTILLTFSILPLKFKSNVLNVPNEHNVPNVLRISALTHLRINASTYTCFLIAGLIALGVAITDEIYQSSIPMRAASITDIFLDFIGIILVLLLIVQFYKKQNI
jgi:hypothetical protein